MSDTPSTTDEPINPELNTKIGKMESDERGGLAYAGSHEEWAWAWYGHRFRAVERGSAYGNEYKAHVARR